MSDMLTDYPVRTVAMSTNLGSLDTLQTTFGNIIPEGKGCIVYIRVSSDSACHRCGKHEMIQRSMHSRGTDLKICVGGQDGFEGGGGSCESTCVSGKDLSIKVDDQKHYVCKQSDATV